MAQAGEPRSRLDLLLVERGLAPSRTKAQALILAGRVFSGETRLDKVGATFPVDLQIAITPGRRYVGRGGHKLAGALAELDFDVEGAVILDVGASTGGFTQVLLEHGATEVVALDVGRGQLDWGLRQDPRVHVIEGKNARYLLPADLPVAPARAVIDVSFISLERILPAVVGCLTSPGELLALVKPQFEIGRGRVGKGGIVREPALHREVLERIAAFVVELGWTVCGSCRSSLPGADGNLEFFVHLDPCRHGAGRVSEADWIERCLDPPTKSRREGRR